jgi:hypothetical protein
MTVVQYTPKTFASSKLLLISQPHLPDDYRIDYNVFVILTKHVHHFDYEHGLINKSRLVNMMNMLVNITNLR